jgi:hypothetical protein
VFNDYIRAQGGTQNTDTGGRWLSADIYYNKGSRQRQVGDRRELINQVRVQTVPGNLEVRPGRGQKPDPRPKQYKGIGSLVQS